MRTVDARGKSCPLPIVLVAQAARAATSGEKWPSKPTIARFPKNSAWCKKTGNELLSLETTAFFEARIKKP